MVNMKTNKAIVCVGSVGQPRDDPGNATYVILHDNAIHFRRVDYDFENTKAKIEARKVCKTPEFNESLMDDLY